MKRFFTLQCREDDILAVQTKLSVCIDLRSPTDPENKQKVMAGWGLESDSSHLVSGAFEHVGDDSSSCRGQGSTDGSCILLRSSMRVGLVFGRILSIYVWMWSNQLVLRIIAVLLQKIHVY